MNTEAKLIQSSQVAFKLRFGRRPSTTVIAPGRINLIGDHTDYSGGLAMPCPINRFICICLSPLNSKDSIIHTSLFPLESWEYDFSDPPGNLQDWQMFIRGAVKLLNLQDKGFAMAIQSYLPPGLGISSSAALGTGLLAALGHEFNCLPSSMDICRLARQIENDFLGVETGLLDQMAIVFGKKGQLLTIDFKNNTIDRTPFAGNNMNWVLVSSGVERKLAASGYTQRVHECQAALMHMQQMKNPPNHFRDIGLSELDWLRKQDKPILYHRMLHYFSENERVRDFAKALQENNLDAAGELLNQSHHSLRDNYESSHPLVDKLQRNMVASPLCKGARIMGGGFGGSVIGLLEKKPGNIERFQTYLSGLNEPNWKMETFQAVDGLKIAEEEIA